ncbi:hypothetical protein [Arthrobacter wenxiniae]|uniref:Uncharacterized protein n=1 Tax=Arthrobacter wenxiniae TaxID=2713570 RepID=A0A7Y7IJE1_9MICC|nr:hypothetical protein [Arthrobacter wenxiniae]NVM96554.1 hypothetical protein [Arthrobacter wenxiniae]
MGARGVGTLGVGTLGVGTLGVGGPGLLGMRDRAQAVVYAYGTGFILAAGR